MYGIDEHGVYFAKQVPTAEHITVSVVNATETQRHQGLFPNTTQGEKDAVAWSLDHRLRHAHDMVPLSAPEPHAGG